VPAVAADGTGVADVWAAVVAHRDHLGTGPGSALAGRRRARAADEVTRLVAARLMERARTLTDGPQAAALAEAVAAGDTDPWTAADELLPPESRAEE